jgi:hypothetical protein
MRFIDEAKILVRSGKGGNGCVSFRREKYIPKGGPDGGDGGKGGDVYLRASSKLLTLYDFRHKRVHEAQNGQPGMGKQRYGRSGDDLIIDVPVGTLVYEILEEGREKLLVDLVQDGQIFLETNLFYSGIRPAVNAGISVSRVGGKAQKAGFRDLVGQLRPSYSQFEELETFSRFASRLDAETTKNLERGKRLRELLRQDRFQGYRDFEQIIIMLALTEGLLDQVPMEKIRETEDMIRSQAANQLVELCREISKGRILTEKDKEKICHFIKDIPGLGQEAQAPAVKG